MLWILWGACFVSFGWGARNHFRNNGLYTAGMRWTLALGTSFALLQAVAIFFGPHPAGSAVCYVLSLSLFWWSVRTTLGKGFGACYAGIESKEFVTDGPYRWVRHPFYTSYLLMWIAGIFLSPWLLVAPAVMGYVYWRAANEEENHLASGPHKEAYEVYRRGTGRFFISWRAGGVLRRKQAA